MVQQLTGIAIVILQKPDVNVNGNRDNEYDTANGSLTKLNGTND